MCHLGTFAMNNFEWDQAKGEWGSESIGCYQSTDYSAMKEVKSGCYDHAQEAIGLHFLFTISLLLVPLPRTFWNVLF